MSAPLLLLFTPGSGGGWPTLSFEVAFADDPSVVSPTWTDLAARLTELVTRRGRQTELDVTETGQATGALRNQDRALDPTNTASAYYPNVVPSRRARIRATILSTVYEIFNGYVEDWPPDWQARRNDVTVSLLDAFEVLNAASFTTSRSAELSGTRANAILDAIGWPAGATFRSIDAGQSTISAVAYDEANALASLQDVARSENGVLFVARDGKVTFHERHKRLTAPYTTVQATFSNQPAAGELPFSNARMTYQRDRIRNRVKINGDGASATVSDAASQARFWRRSYEPADVLITSAAEVQAHAEYVLGRLKDAIVRVEEVTLEPQQDANLWAHCLGREQGDRIRVLIYPPGSPSTVIDQTVVIEAVAHSVPPETKRWQTTFSCSPADLVTYWVLGQELLGTETRLAY